MARIRTIKPEFFKNEQLAELPAMSRLLFIGLWTLADRAGRLEDRPKRIKADVFPYDNMDVEKALNDLQSKGFIIRYKGNANITDRILPPEQPTTELNCIEIINFLKHQKIDGYNEKPSLLPASQPQDLLKTIPSLVIDGEGKGRERKGKEGVLPATPKKKNEFIPNEAQIKSFESFKAWMDENTPTVAKMEIPITIKQLFILRGLLPNSKGVTTVIPKEECLDMLLQIENNKQYLKKYRSPYLCILAWHRNNLKK